MPTFGTINAYIKVDGTGLTEYDVQIDEKKKSVSCWIASETGKVRSLCHCSIYAFLRSFKNFSVCWNNTKLSINTAGIVELDGVSAGGSLAEKGSSDEQEVASVYTSPTTVRHYRFASIMFTGM